ncbi:MAG: dihydrofolate reductase [Xanthobacteraceae bacterium]
MEIVFVVAAAANGVIGNDNRIPWRIKRDMQRLRALTMNRPVVMGRKTFQSLPRPLPGRTNIVLTRDRGFCADQALVVTSLEQAREVATGDALRRFATEIMVIGGSEIYRQWLPQADRIELTEVHADVAGDAVFRPDLSGWEEVARSFNKAGEGDTADFSYVTLRRTSQAADSRPIALTN